MGGAIRNLAAVLLLSALALVAGCGPRRPPELNPDAPAMGVYRATLVRPHERTRRFRLLVFARLPDRLHAEVLSPLGTTEMILDSGGGQLAVTLVDEKLAYVGAATPEALERAVGLPVAPPALVGALLFGTPAGEGLEVVRSPARRGRLPRNFELRAGARRLELELKRRVVLPDAVSDLGTGRAPEGVARRPLDELRPAGRAGAPDRAAPPG